MDITEINKTLANIAGDQRAILKACEHEKRVMTADEVTRYKGNDARAAELRIEAVKSANPAAVLAPVIAPPAAAVVATPPVDPAPAPFQRQIQLPRENVTPAGYHVQGGTGNAPDGRVGIGREQRMVDTVPGARRPEGRLSLGKIVKGLALGDWTDADAEHRALAGSSAAAGGVMVPTPISTEVIDLVRAQSAVIRAGARTIAMTSATLKVPRVVSDVAVGWRAENAAFATGDPVFEPVTLSAKTLGGIVKTSIELAEDVTNLDQTLYGLLSQAIAVELDRACLLGSGSGSEPTGLKNQTGVQTMTAVGALAGYTPFVRATQRVLERNGQPGAVITSPRTLGDLAGLTDTTGQPLNPPKILDALSWLPTTNVPTNGGTGTDESLAFVGDFSQLWIGMRTNLFFEVNRYSDSAFGNGQIHLRAYLRGDCMVARPAHFVVMSGLKSPA